jgi:SPP1 family predicted phage head-tail adaptor
MRGTFIDPGRFRTELVLETASLASDELGGHVESWTEVATVLAAIEPLTATSVFGADQTLEHVTHRISLRARADLASGMRFRKGARVFDIVTVHDPDESGRYQLCRAREIGR